MADNTQLNSGTGGDVIATDDIAGVKHQRVKLEWGGDGVATEIEDSSGKRLPVKIGSTTSTVTSVSDTNSSTTILASNASRIGASVFNDSSAVLYLLLGTGTASASNYTVKIYQNGYFEVPSGFTGQLTGVWATDPNDGGAKVTELV